MFGAIVVIARRLALAALSLSLAPDFQFPSSLELNSHSRDSPRGDRCCPPFDARDNFLIQFSLRILLTAWAFASITRAPFVVGRHGAPVGEN